MNGENNDNDEIAGHLKKIYAQLDSQDVIELGFVEFIDYLPFCDGEDAVNKESIVYLSTQR